MKRSALLAVLFVCLYCMLGTVAPAEGSLDRLKLVTDKSMYQPNSSALVTLSQLPQETAKVRLTLYHLGDTVWQRDEAHAESVKISLPDIDFTGYLLQAEALNEHGAVLALGQVGIDVSSSWTKFPRYGYVWDYTVVANPQEKIDLMATYHLNGIQFYDWQYRHHQPIADNASSWKDWSGRTISGDIIRAYIDRAHEKNMACMAYNMIYAANKTYLSDGSGVSPDWRLVKQSGEDFTCDMNASLGDVGGLQYFNLLDPAWQSYIFAQENKVFDAFAFDGWHGDTIGENGAMQTPDGKPLGYDEDGKPIRYVKDGYTAFLNAAKKAIGAKYLSFNPVGAQGIEHVNISDVDVLYTEFWPWDRNQDGELYDTYASIHKAIVQACEQSGGKSLVVAAYINYRNPKSSFNTPALRMMDSVIFASGGAHIELGNGDCVLSDEYFPSDYKKKMRFTLPEDVQRLYDFSVAYENLLRDGQKPTERTVSLESIPTSMNGKADTVWVFSKGNETEEVYHFINLMGTDNRWRDEKQLKKAPLEQKEVCVKIYTEKVPATVNLASPDREDLRTMRLDFDIGQDVGGAYITFTMPTLAYWNMVFLR